jgi:hypothetical protein
MPMPAEGGRGDGPSAPTLKDKRDLPITATDLTRGATRSAFRSDWDKHGVFPARDYPSGCLTTLVLSANFGMRRGKGGRAMAIVTISSQLGAGGPEP